MKVMLEVVGPIHKKPEPNPIEVELEAGSRLIDLMTRIGYLEQEARHLTYLRAGKRVKLLETLQEGDRIEAVLHVGGG
jgi:hypothetical protein